MTLLGYNDKLRILLERVVEKIASFEVKHDRFSVIKVILILPKRSHLFSFFSNIAAFFCFCKYSEHTSESPARFVLQLLNMIFLDFDVIYHFYFLRMWLCYVALLIGHIKQRGLDHRFLFFPSIPR